MTCGTAFGGEKCARDVLGRHPDPGVLYLPNQFKRIKRVDFAETERVEIMRFSPRLRGGSGRASYPGLGRGGFKAHPPKTAGRRGVYGSTDFYEPLLFNCRVEDRLGIGGKAVRFLIHGFPCRREGEERMVARRRLGGVHLRVGPETKGIKSARISAGIAARLGRAPADLLEKFSHGGASI